MQIPKIAAFITLAFVLLIGCSQNGETENDVSENEEQEQELTEFEMEHGIGPVDEEIAIEEVDEELAQKGMEVFDMKCGACHKMDERYVGPPLGGITDTRSPTYIMNMILNPEEMVEKHPIAKSLMNEYLTPMPNQNLSREEARAVVEYLSTNPE